MFYSLDFLLLAGSGILVAIASGVMGSFLVLRKMTLLSDALSHIALPGIALGLLLHIQPLIGGFAFLFLGILLVWGIEHKTQLAIESITGVLFVTALAAGALMMPETELLETFFGSADRLAPLQLWIQGGIALVVAIVALCYLRPLILTSIAPDLAVAEKIPRARMELLLLGLIALTITIGIGFVGILLMSALAIIPAATARNLSFTYTHFLWWCITLSVSSILIGLFIHTAFDIGVGIATVFPSALFFTISLFQEQK